MAVILGTSVFTITSFFHPIQRGWVVYNQMIEIINKVTQGIGIVLSKFSLFISKVCNFLFVQHLWWTLGFILAIVIIKKIRYVKAYQNTPPRIRYGGEERK